MTSLRWSTRSSAAVSDTSAGQAALALHSMAVLQVFQAKLLWCMDEAGLDPAAFREMRSATALVLHATMTAAHAIGRSIASLVVLEHHLWLTLTENKVTFLDSPVPRHGYALKMLSTPFRAQVILLSALPPIDEDQELKLLCPIRALKIYLKRSALFRQSEQILVCFGNRTKGRPIRKQRLSKWIVDAITLAYTSLGQLPH